MPAALFALCLSVSAGAQEPAVGDLVVRVEGLEVQTGTLKLTLFDDAEAYPKRSEAAVRRIDIPVRGEAVDAKFVGVPFGTYAVSVHHDENGNEELDTTFLGIPREGLGASNDATGFMGPPKFDAAAFSIASSEVSITVHMAY